MDSSQWRELNPWPHPYQGCALPLSYIGFNPYGWSGRRDSNSRHSAWKADALPTELLPLIWLAAFGQVFGGGNRIRTYSVEDNRFTVCPGSPTPAYPLVPVICPPLSRRTDLMTMSRWRDSNPRPADYKSAALASWATSASFFKELRRRIAPVFRTANVRKNLVVTRGLYIFSLRYSIAIANKLVFCYLSNSSPDLFLLENLTSNGI